MLQPHYPAGQVTARPDDSLLIQLHEPPSSDSDSQSEGLTLPVESVDEAHAFATRDGLFRHLLGRFSQRLQHTLGHRLIQPLRQSAQHHLPSRCAICHSWPAEPSGQTLCEACVTQFAQPEPRCHTCALPLPVVFDHALPASLTTTQSARAQCGACIKHPPSLDACFAAVSYNYPWNAFITEFKFNQHIGWAHSFAHLLRNTPWVEPALEQCELMLPMPLSTQRLKERGFNQAYELVKQLAQQNIPINPRLLLRLRDTAPQTKLSRAQRQRNVRSAFAVEPMQIHQVKNRRIILVDDVMTSGATLFAAAACLKQAGAAQVTALVVARTDWR